MRRKLNEDMREFESELKDLKRIEAEIKEHEGVVQAKLKEAMEKYPEIRLEMENIKRVIQFSKNLKQDIERDIRQFYLHYRERAR